MDQIVKKDATWIKATKKGGNTDSVFQKFCARESICIALFAVLLGISAKVAFGFAAIGIPCYVGKGVLSKDDIDWIVGRCAKELQHASDIFLVDPHSTALTSAKRNIYKRMAEILYYNYGMKIYGQHGHIQLLPLGLVWFIETFLGGALDCVAYFTSLVTELGTPTRILHHLAVQHGAHAEFKDHEKHQFEWMMPKYNVQKDIHWWEKYMMEMEKITWIYDEMEKTRVIRHSKYLSDKSQ
eukprot:488443_1